MRRFLLSIFNRPRLCQLEGHPGMRPSTRWVYRMPGLNDGRCVAVRCQQQGYHCPRCKTVLGEWTEIKGTGVGLHSLTMPTADWDLMRSQGWTLA